MAEITEASEILIAGCGIGGATAALALGRAGFSVRVLERAPVIEEVGAGLQVGPNAMRILRDLDVRRHLASKEVLPDRAVMRDVRTDEEIVAIDFGDEFRALYEEPYAVMHRGDLLSGLMKAAEATGNVVILPGQNVEEIEDLGTHVRVTTAEGVVHTGRALIGADGIRSRVRRHVIDDDVPLASKYVIYRGTIPRSEAVENAVTLRAGDRHHVMHYPIRGGDEVNVVVSFRSEAGPVGSSEWGTEDELDARFAAASPFVKDLLAQIDRTHKWVQFDRAPQAGWSIGNVVLTGDAAHPTHQYLAQGAGQAMEDAVALAAVLTEFFDDIPRAWREFESRRFDRASAVQRGSRFWGELSHVGGVEADQRDALLRSIGADGRKVVDWIYTTRDDVPLPEVPPHREVYEPLKSEKVLS